MLFNFFSQAGFMSGNNCFYDYYLFFINLFQATLYDCIIGFDWFDNIFDFKKKQSWRMPDFECLPTQNSILAFEIFLGFYWSLKSRSNVIIYCNEKCWENLWNFDRFLPRWIHFQFALCYQGLTTFKIWISDCTYKNQSITTLTSA